MYRRSDQFRPTRPSTSPSEHSHAPSPDSADDRPLGGRLREAINGFSIFDDEDDDRRQAARAKKVEQAKPNLAVVTVQMPDLLADARRKLQVIVGVSVGMSMMAIVYVFAKMMTASIMKLAPAAFH